MPAPYTPQSSTHTGDNVLAEVRRTLGDTAGTLFSNDDVLSWVNAAQREIAQQVDLMGKATISIVAGQPDYVIDVELSKRIRDIQALAVGGTRLRALTFQQAQDAIMAPALDLQQDTPEAWYQYNRTVTLVPTPAESVPNGLTIWFSRMPVDIETSADYLDIPDSHYNALVMYVHGRAYLLTQEQELAGTAMSSAQASIKEQQNRERRSQINSYPTLVQNEDHF